MGIESISIVLKLEEVFGVQFPDRIARDARTVRDLEDLVLGLRAAQLSPSVAGAVSDGEVREVVRGVVAGELRIDVALVIPGADLVRDLGMDA